MSGSTDAPAPVPGLVIIGAGECGARAAVTLREQGWQGAITLVGDEPHPPYERPPLSKAAGGGLPIVPNGDAVRFDDLRIAHVAKRRAVSIDRQRRMIALDDGTSLSFEKLLLATGASARRMTVPGGEKALCLRTPDDAQRIRRTFSPGRRVAIVGAGLIGMELAASAAAEGCHVVVIERQSRVLSRSTPSVLAGIIEARHRAAGVEFLFGTGVAAIADQGEGLVVQLSSGSQLATDTVIAGIGATPNAALAEAAGLAIDNGISTDPYLQTSDAAIFAAGDCASSLHPLFDHLRLRPECWRNAIEQGARAARNMLGERLEPDSAPWFWSDQYELCLQVAGLPQLGETIVRRPLEDAALMLLHLDANGVLVAAGALGPLGRIAKEMLIAEKLIARRCRPDQSQLGEPGTRLKSLLAA